MSVTRSLFYLTLLVTSLLATFQGRTTDAAIWMVAAVILLAGDD